MLEQDQVARWIVGLSPEDDGDELTRKFLASSSLAWPRVLAHVRHELAGRGLNSDEVKSLALEIWEETLRSVWRTCRERPGWSRRIENLENYLIGAFHHRFNRHVKRRKRQDSLLEFRPAAELAQLKDAANVDNDFGARMDRGIQLEQAYAAMNPNMRRAVIASVYGFSWAEIAKRFETGEQNLIMRVQYALRKVRGKFTQG
jgi:DNA-directed RNA polymerase specialized sigma24 family protein